MYERGYLLLLESLYQLLPVRNPHDILVINVPLVQERFYDIGSRNGTIIKGRQPAAAAVVLVEIGQFHREESGLQFIQPAVVPPIFIVIATLRAIIGQGTNGLCQLRIVRGNGSPVAQSA